MQNPERTQNREPGRWMVPALIFVVCWVMTTHGKYSASGDEPHYLMVCRSLWADGDLDLRNNYRNDDGSRFGATGLEAEQHARENPAGRLLPVHDLGVPVALMPVYGVAAAASSVSSEAILARFRMTRGLFAYSLISLCILGLVTLAAAVTRAALVAHGATSGTASTVVLTIWLSPPILSNSFLVFPEPFALLATAFAVHVAFATAEERFRVRAPMVALAMGLLPWFHRKYAAYAAMLLLAVWWWRRRQMATLRSRDRWLLAVLYVAPQAALAVWTLSRWGSLGGPLMLDGVPFSWTAFKSGAFGLLVDRENGLFAWAPVYLLAPAVWAIAGRRYALWLFPVASLYLMSAAHHQWWAGFSPAGRFLVPVFPIVAVLFAPASRQPIVRVACLVLLLPQVFMAADGWQHTRSLWPQGDGHNRVLGDLLALVGARETLLPSLRTSPDGVGGAALGVGLLAVINLVIWAVSRRGRQKDATEG